MPHIEELRGRVAAQPLDWRGTEELPDRQDILPLDKQGLHITGITLVVEIHGKYNGWVSIEGFVYHGGSRDYPSRCSLSSSWYPCSPPLRIHRSSSWSS